MSVHIIDNKNDLQAYCDHAKTRPWLALDTEFLRERTYYAKLCLVQLATDQKNCAVDVLAIEDISPLAELISQIELPVILHSSRQDFEVLFQSLGVLPSNAFDTQIAAAFCGSNMQIGYSAIVKDRVGKEVAASQARTDWSRRPLSIEQLTYAMEDVEFLGELREGLIAELTQNGRFDWYQQAVQELYTIEDYSFPPELAWRRMKGGRLSIRSQHILKGLAIWRERKAQQLNIPRTWLIKDPELIGLAAQAPETMGELMSIDDIAPRFREKNANEILSEVARANKENLTEVLWTDGLPFSNAQRKLVKKAMQLLNETAENINVASALIATKRDVEGILRGDRDRAPLLSWRYDVYGRQLLELLDA
jgi:ribonuclease D